MSFHPDALWLLALAILIPIAFWPVLRKTNRAPIVFSGIEGARIPRRSIITVAAAAKVLTRPIIEVDLLFGHVLPAVKGLF